MNGASTLRMLSNHRGIAGAARESGIAHELLPERPGRLGRLIQLLGVALRGRRWDVILLDCATFETVILGACLQLVPRAACSLVATDLILPRPSTAPQRAMAALKRLALRRVDRFVLYQRDYREYTRWYGMIPGRVEVVPFKVNGLHAMEGIDVREGDYAFASGVSARDWPTLAAASRELPIPLVISVPGDARIRELGMTTRPPHPSDFAGSARIVRDDGSLEGWLRLMAEARFVVIPLRSESISPSGLSVCVTAMALGKCVIISGGPTASALPSRGTVITVPAGDAAALRAAMIRVDGDPDLRRVTGEAARAYARACGSAERLHRDFVRIARDAARTRSSGSARRPAPAVDSPRPAAAPEDQGARGARHGRSGIAALAVEAWARSPYFPGKWRLTRPIARPGRAEVVVAARRGLLWELDLSCPIQRSLYYLGWWERKETTLLLDMVRPGWTVVDVGANFGYFALVLGRAIGPEGRVLAVEPASVPLAQLRRNRELNAMPWVEPLQMALGEGAGAGFIDVAPGESRCSQAVRDSAAPGREAVQITSLDDLVDGQPVHAMKIDVEGFETKVLDGARDTIERCRPLLLIELNPDACERAGSSVEGIVDRLGQMNYWLGHLGRGGLRKLDALPRAGEYLNAVALPGLGGRARCASPGRAHPEAAGAERQP